MTTSSKRLKQFFCLVFVLSIALVPLVSPDFLELLHSTAQAATTFTVNSVNDTPDSNTADGICNDGSGNCTLRAAIEQANALAGPDTINFSIGSGAKTIVQSSDYPIISDPVVIDGTTQPGFAGTPIIEINGNNRGNTNHACFFITAGSSTIKGLVINRVNNASIALITNGGNHIEGNFIGTDVTGTIRRPNGFGIIVNSGTNTVGGTTAAARNVISGGNGTGIEMNTLEAINNVIEGNYIGVNAAGTAALANNSLGIRLTGSGNRIGGTTPGARNVISGNSDGGIEVGGQMTTIQGNFIGTNADGTAAIPNNGRGIRVFNSPNNIIGGPTASAGNVISGNIAAGISVEESGSTNNVIQGNLIGTDVSGLNPIPNSAPGFGVPNTVGGIFINRGSNNVIGGTSTGAANRIAFNGGPGVRVITLPNTSVGINNQITGNMIFSNLGLGIDLGPDGVTPNDVGDSDSDANKLQNFPIITTVSTVGGATTVSGSLSSMPNTNYQLEFFANRACNSLGNGDGARFLESRMVTTDGAGNTSFQFTLQSVLAVGDAITATATDPTGNTSEFSPCSSTESAGTIQFGVGTLNVREDLSTLNVPLVRVGGTKGTITINFASSNGTAIAGQDYSAVNGMVSFADGEVSKSISIPILNDAVIEQVETFFVTLSHPADPELLGPNSVITISILDANQFPVLSVISLNVNEGNSGTSTAVVTVALNAAVGQVVTVDYQTFAMTAVGGTDFVPTSGSLSFAPGITSLTVSVQVIGDTLDEDNEQFRIGLSNAVNAAISVSSNPPTVTIVDDDQTPTLSINDVGVIEGTSGTTDAVFNISLSAASGRAVTVNFATADGTATAGSDYQSKTGNVFFVPGETSKQVTVLVNGDMVDEPLETFFLNLSGPVNAVLADSQGVATIGTATMSGVSFSATSYSTTESAHFAQIVVTRSGNTTAPMSVDYATSDGSAKETSDYTSARGTLRFNAGEISKSFIVLVNEDGYLEGDETVNLTLTNPSNGVFIVGSSTAVLLIGDSTASTVNPIDDPQFFVRQHYHDFLNREPDPSGFEFWVGNLTSCGANAQCLEVRRINVSAAFFLSIEFQETGYLVYRVYKAALGNLPSAPVPVRLTDFLRDTQEIGLGVQVGSGTWEAQLEANKQAYTLAFVQRSEFLAAFPNGMTAQEFVDKLNMNAGGVLSASEQADLIAVLGATPADINKRSQVLRLVAEDADLKTAEFNRAFVLMQYFGYLRRNPNDLPDSNFDGYNFWLTKLNQFGNFVDAEMVKAFLNSLEYRRRFGM